MKAIRITLLAATALLLAGLFSACESNDSGPANSITVYYGAAFYDPWYHGDWDDDYDIVVHPPGGGNRPPGSGDIGAHPEHPIARPPGGDNPRPEHPIAKPPGSERPPSASQLPSSRPPSASTRPVGGASARPAPSIPSTPRAAPRGGGGRRR